MKDLTVIIPVWNLQAVRDIDRLRLSILSLQQTQAPPVRVLVVDGSCPEYSPEVKTICNEFQNAVYVPVSMQEFNKPKLLNEGCRISTTPWILCTDADYLFSPDLLKAAEKLRRHDRMLLHQAEVLPDMVIPDSTILNWRFGKYPNFEFGKWACGAFQYFHRDWFEYSGGYDERMQGHGGMDHDFRDRCDRAKGFHTTWMTQGQILHQWHPVSKAKTPEAKQRFQNNIKLANNDKTVKRN